METDTEKMVPTRIAIYDDLLSAPRVVDIPPGEISEYIEQISANTYRFAQEAGGSIPYTVIKEVCENFIHAQFKEPCVSILDHGNTIRFTDQGPGIEDKERAQLPGFTSASTEMKQYIRGVGSGLPTVREYLRFSNGRLIIEDNIKAGTVVTIAMDAGRPQTAPVVYREHAMGGHPFTPPPSPHGSLEEKELDILALAAELGSIGPTALKENLGMSVSTAHRTLAKLEERGFLESTDKRKKTLTEQGMQALGEVE